MLRLHTTNPHECWIVVRVPIPNTQLKGLGWARQPRLVESGSVPSNEKTPPPVPLGKPTKTTHIPGISASTVKARYNLPLMAFLNAIQNLLLCSWSQLPRGHHLSFASPRSKAISVISANSDVILRKLQKPQYHCADNSSLSTG